MGMSGGLSQAALCPGHSEGFPPRASREQFNVSGVVWLGEDAAQTEGTSLKRSKKSEAAGR